MKILCTIFLLCAVALVPIAAQYEWEGNAVVGTYGEFPRDGNYAASNTFSRNTVVVVTNVATGAQTELIVTRRLEEPGIFMLLSEDAGNELEIRGDRPVRVRARPSYGNGITAVSPSQDLPYSPDPDVNPAAGAGDPNAAALRPGAREPLSEAPEAPAEITSPRVAPMAEEPGAVASVVPEPSPRRPEAAVVPAPAAATAAAGEPAQPRGGVTQGIDTAAGRLIDPTGGDPVRSFPPVSGAPAEEPGEPEAAPAEPVSDTVDPGLGTQRPADAGVIPSVTPVPSVRQAEEPSEEAPEVEEETPDTDNRIERALQMVQSRMPKSRLFPAAEEDSVATFMPPQRPEDAPLELSGRLAEAQPPSGESDAPVLVEVPQPPAEAPEEPLETGPVAADLGPVDAPEEELIAAALPEAEPRVERPAADHLGQIGAPSKEEAPEELPEAAPIPPEDSVLSLVPAEERPPVGPPTPREEEPTAEPAPAEEPRVAALPPRGDEWAAANLPLVKSLGDEAYYLQVGAYTNPQSAKTAVDGLATDYPTAVLETAVEDRQVYRVFVGPLEADEQGTVLYFVRAKGYRDAFIRTGGR
jgi:hypothetical protein